jgi:hypothetical protein
VKQVGAGVIEEADARVADHFVPVGDRPLEAVEASSLGHGFNVAAGNRYQLRQQRRLPRHVGDGPVRIRMGLTHEPVTEHAYADCGGLLAH